MEKQRDKRRKSPEDTPAVKDCYTEEIDAKAENYFAQESRAQKQRRLDEAGLRYYELAGKEEDAAARQAAAEEIAVLIYQLFLRDDCSDRLVNEWGNGLAQFWTSDLNNYDPHKGNSFSKYVYWRMYYRRTKQTSADEDRHRIKYEDSETGQVKRGYVSRKANLDLDDPEGKERRNRLEELPNERFRDELANAEGDTAELIYSLTASILQLPQRLHGRAKNETRLRYFRMFYTAGMTKALKDETARLDMYQKHERDLFDAMELAFLDYYMLPVCRTVTEVSCAPLKKESALIEGGADEEAKLPLAEDVYRAYLERVHHYPVSRPAISQQKTAYKQYMEGVVTEHMRAQDRHWSRTRRR